MPRLGLIAGNGRFPLVFVEAARAEGIDIVAVAHQGETPPEICALVPEVTWVRVGELGKIIATFQAAGITQAVMAGGIHKAGALAHLQLGRAYLISGDRTKAKSAYQDFLTLWKDADPDIPILKQAKAEYARVGERGDQGD